MELRDSIFFLSDDEIKITETLQADKVKQKIRKDQEDDDLAILARTTMQAVRAKQRSNRDEEVEAVAADEQETKREVDEPIHTFQMTLPSALTTP